MENRNEKRSIAELSAICEALIFVSDEPVSSEKIASLTGESKETIDAVIENLAREYEERKSGLQIRQVAGGWEMVTRPEYHEPIKSFLKTKSSAKLSIAALETLAVIAYKQPITIAEILEIRGVQSASAIKTLLDRKLIAVKGRKDTVGRPVLYGTSKEFLIQFGLKDLSELPSIEDFNELVNGVN
ncbi:MAG: SMC-Scp complex subunit ScpB [Pyrinomonadaceae bacterium]|nr:SMC-Scp complex subunit ScpB [Pyrinomonadaceae bacterium]MCX7640809.1 SMC-Scp complex subunit ScpB [Pyrinomonadaceae bacterium]MDW8303426.1 SMC-Scp complex subunit ScpB [Acidobacteriota bacterium]